MMPKMSPAQAALPVAPYIGGKRVLAKRLCKIIDSQGCTSYVEPFVGMGGVFFRRSMCPKVEVINDLGRDVSNLFRILQRHYPQFIELLRFQLTMRSEFQRLMLVDPETLTDLERAARFLYIQRTSYGGKVRGPTFGVSKERPARFNVATLEPMLQDVYNRLQGVIIERLPFLEVLERYDRPGALFYLDPPYWGCERDYGDELFGRDDFGKLANRLAELRGRFVLSINDNPDVRDIFADFYAEEVGVTYTIGHGKKRQTGANSELIITNFDTENSFALRPR